MVSKREIGKCCILQMLDVGSRRLMNLLFGGAFRHFERAEEWPGSALCGSKLLKHSRFAFAKKANALQQTLGSSALNEA